ncbi:MAG: hypothetical protein WC750_05290 [Patescibacteria group bacterium]|jgi:hypothetical protein
MSTRSFKTRPPRINYRKIRTDLLRVCLESLLALIAKPCGRHLKRWRKLESYYNQLTSSRPLYVPTPLSLDDFRNRRALDGKSWFELLESVKDADKELGNGSDFFSRYLAVSPFEGMIVFWTRPHLGTHSKEEVEEEILRLRVEHGIRGDASPAYSYDDGRFVAFHAAASDRPAA